MSVNDSHAGSRVIIKHAGRHTMKRKIFHSSSSCTFFIFCGLLNADISRRAQSLNGRRRGLESRGEERTREKKKRERKREIWTIQQQRPRKTALSARTAEAPATHTVSLEGLGPQPSNCGSVHWMADTFTATNGTQKKKKAMCARRASPA